MQELSSIAQTIAVFIHRSIKTRIETPRLEKKL